MFLKTCSYLKMTFRCFRTAITVRASDNKKTHLVQIVRSHIEYSCSRLPLTSYQQDQSDCILGRLLISLELKVNIGLVNIAKYRICSKVIFNAIKPLLNYFNAYSSVVLPSSRKKFLCTLTFESIVEEWDYIIYFVFSRHFAASCSFVTIRLVSRIYAGS